MKYNLLSMVAFAAFVLLTFWRELELFLRPHPHVVWASVSYEKSSAMKYQTRGYGGREGTREDAYFVRLIFNYKAKYPSGA